MRLLLIEEYSATIGLKKNKWTIINPNDHPKLSTEFYDLISTAYAEIGGHAKVNSPSDVFTDPDWTYWDVIDIDEDPDVDLIVFGQQNKYGIKFSGVGHDGTKLAKKTYLADRAAKLSMKGYFGEVSGKFAEILVAKYNVHSVGVQADIEKVIAKPIVFHGEHPDGKTDGYGWYSRKIGSGMHIKLLVGNPKL